MKFFKAVWIWIKTHILISAIIGGALVVGITLAIVLPITLSNKGAKEQETSQSIPTSSSSSESSEPEPEPDPHQVLPGWEDATDLTFGVSVAAFQMENEGEVVKFKCDTTEGDGFHYMYLKISGSNNSGNAIKYEYFNYKGELFSSTSYFWGTYDGYYYIKLTKLDNEVSTFNTFMLTHDDLVLPFGEVTKLETPITPSPTYPKYIRIFVEQEKRVGFSFTGSNLNNAVYKAFDQELNEIVVTDNFDAMASKYKYNFDARVGYNYIRILRGEGENVPSLTYFECNYSQAE